jgi:hypothetical protein
MKNRNDNFEILRYIMKNRNDNINDELFLTELILITKNYYIMSHLVSLLETPVPENLTKILYQVTKMGYLDILEYLVKNFGFPIYWKSNYEWMSLLENAINSKNIDVFEFIVDSIGDRDLVIIDILHLLISNEADNNMLEYFLNVVSMHSSFNYTKAIIDEIIENNIIPYNIKAVKILINLYIKNIHKSNLLDYISIIDCAISNKNIKALNFLLSIKNYSNEEINLIIKSAIIYNDTNLLIRLLREYPDQDFNSLMISAIKMERLDIIEYLNTIKGDYIWDFNLIYNEAILSKSPVIIDNILRLMSHNINIKIDE